MSRRSTSHRVGCHRPGPSHHPLLPGRGSGRITSSLPSRLSSVPQLGLSFTNGPRPALTLMRRPPLLAMAAHGAARTLPRPPLHPRPSAGHTQPPSQPLFTPPACLPMCHSLCPECSSQHQPPPAPSQSLWVLHSFTQLGRCQGFSSIRRERTSSFGFVFQYVTGQ